MAQLRQEPVPKTFQGSTPSIESASRPLVKPEDDPGEVAEVVLVVRRREWVRIAS